MIEDVLVGFEDAVRQPVVTHELPDVFDRVELGAFRQQSGKRVMLAGATRPAEMCQLALSSISTAWAPSATAGDISAMCSVTTLVLQGGITSAAPLPSVGQMALYISSDVECWSLGAGGRVPRLVQRPVMPFFWPTRASSCRQTVQTGEAASIHGLWDTVGRILDLHSPQGSTHYRTAFGCYST
jgi:hypothetical protein